MELIFLVISSFSRAMMNPLRGAAQGFVGGGRHHVGDRAPDSDRDLSQSAPTRAPMSTISRAPTESLMSRKRCQSMTREYAENPATTIFGAVLGGQLLHLIVVHLAGFRVQAVLDPRCSSAPEKLTCEPWVRCPPCANAMPSSVSPGSSNAVYYRRIRLRSRMRLHIGVVCLVTNRRPGRSPAARPRPHARSRRSSAWRDSLPRTCW